MAAPIAAAPGAPTILAVGRVAVAWIAAAVATGIGTVIGIVIVTCMRRCCDHERTEQCEDACHDQCQSAAPWRAGGSRTVHCNLQHASVWSRDSRGKKFDQSATGCTRNQVDRYAFAPCGRQSR